MSKNQILGTILGSITGTAVQYFVIGFSTVFGGVLAYVSITSLF